MAAGYAALVTGFYHRAPAVESVFGGAGDDARRALGVYLEVIGVDPVRQAIEVRLDFATQTGGGAHFPALPKSAITIHLNDGNDVQDIELAAARPADSRTVRLGLRGAMEILSTAMKGACGFEPSKDLISPAARSCRFSSRHGRTSQAGA